MNPDLMTRLMSTYFWNGKIKGGDNRLIGNMNQKNQKLSPEAWNESSKVNVRPANISRKIHALTAREKAVIALVAQGMRNQQIADRLSISPIAVKQYLTAILTKLDLNNRFELAIFAYRYDLAD